MPRGLFRFFKSIRLPLLAIFLTALLVVRSRESKMIMVAVMLLLVTIAGPWMAHRAIKGGNATVYPYFQAWRNENPVGFWAIIAFYLCASALSAVLFLAVIDPGDFSRQTFSWQQYWVKK